MELFIEKSLPVGLASRYLAIDNMVKSSLTMSKKSCKVRNIPVLKILSHQLKFDSHTTKSAAPTLSWM